MKLNEEKKELREQLNVSQYTCKKQSEDLQAAWRDLNDLQKSMVRIKTPITRLILTTWIEL